ncbi:hypothetical protein NKH77_48810 [Streptomyces sp. M19]
MEVAVGAPAGALGASWLSTTTIEEASRSRSASVRRRAASPAAGTSSMARTSSSCGTETRPRLSSPSEALRYSETSSKDGSATNVPPFTPRVVVSSFCEDSSRSASRSVPRPTRIRAVSSPSGAAARRAAARR